MDRNNRQRKEGGGRKYVIKLSHRIPVVVDSERGEVRVTGRQQFVLAMDSGKEIVVAIDLSEVALREAAEKDRKALQSQLELWQARAVKHEHDVQRLMVEVSVTPRNDDLYRWHNGRLVQSQQRLERAKQKVAELTQTLNASYGTPE